ncbi:MAG: type IV pilin-like G/H family protein [Coleofasciculus sp. G3-WIS-01]|uniref:type IV pilin-like G/H family protein n=1 Tax=Coleofasciculus sp. G3-WIS-01 TaxID=3069528 RepID=UPI0032FC44BF
MNNNGKFKLFKYLTNLDNDKGVYEQNSSIISLAIFIILIVVSLAGLKFTNYQNSIKEGREYVGSMNRLQQAYYLENSKFSDKLDNLGLRGSAETENYRYHILFGQPEKPSRYRFVEPHSINERWENISIVMNLGLPKKPNLKTYVGLVFFPEIADLATTQPRTIFVCETMMNALLWESQEPSTAPPLVVVIPPDLEIEKICGNIVSGSFPPPEGFQEYQE